MASKRRTADQSNDERRITIIGEVISISVKVVLYFLGMLLVSIFIEWLGLIFWWPEQGLQHSIDMLNKEIEYLGAANNENFIFGRPDSIITLIQSWFNDIQVGIETSIQAIHQLQSRDLGIMGPIINYALPALQSAFVFCYDFIVSALTITCVFMVRGTILLVSQQVFILLGIVGYVHGLTQRYLKTQGCARVDAAIYHWAKMFPVPFLVLPWTLYLSMPWSIHPNLVILPFALLFAITVGIISSTYKKHL